MQHIIGGAGIDSAIRQAEAEKAARLRRLGISKPRRLSKPTL